MSVYIFLPIVPCMCLWTSGWNKVHYWFFYCNWSGFEFPPYFPLGRRPLLNVIRTARRRSTSQKLLEQLRSPLFDWLLRQGVSINQSNVGLSDAAFRVAKGTTAKAPLESWPHSGKDVSDRVPKREDLKHSGSVSKEQHWRLSVSWLYGRGEWSTQ